MLSEAQRRAFEDDGYVVIHDVFQVDELAWLGEEARALDLRLSSRPRPLRWSSDEAPGGTHIDVHAHEDAFRRLAWHPRLLNLIRALGHGPLRLHRTRLCPGARLGRGDPIWRRDFEIWRRTGALTAPNAVTAAVVLDGYHVQAPAIHVARGSHRVPGTSPADATCPIRLSASFGSVILIHCATSYALSRPGDAAARILFLVTYDDAAMASERGSERAWRDTAAPHAADRSLWPVPLWVSG